MQGCRHRGSSSRFGCPTLAQEFPRLVRHREAIALLQGWPRWPRIGENLDYDSWVGRVMVWPLSGVDLF
jgi:hypothetical protein